jgi:hypothetical protein
MLGHLCVTIEPLKMKIDNQSKMVGDKVNNCVLILGVNLIFKFLVLENCSCFNSIHLISPHASQKLCWHPKFSIARNFESNVV